MLVLLGCSHRSAPVAVREKVAFAPDQIGPAISTLLERGPLQEACVLSTCNRVEFLARLDGSAEQGKKAIRDYLIETREISAKDLDRCSYDLSGRAVVAHLFRVASGLDSMILGEPQILGQVKQAYRDARLAGGLGSITDRLFQQCLHTAKRIRTETGISRNAVSVGFAAAKLAGQIFGDLSGRSILLLGAGKMAELVAKHLLSGGAGKVTVASRTYNHAVAAAERFSGEAIQWARFPDALATTDIVVSCTASQRPILSRAAIAQAVRRRRAPLFLIDIAVPRDIDPAAHELDNVYLYDIDGLQGVVDSNLEQRKRAAATAEHAIEIEVDLFEKWRQELNLTPTILALREHVQSAGRKQWDRYRRKLGPMSTEQETMIEEMIRGVAQKILHEPVKQLRSSVERGDVEATTALYRRIFGLDQDRERKTREQGRGPQRLLKGGRDG